MNTVEQRLAYLERSVRRYRVTTWALALAFVVAATVAASGDGVKDLVRARRFEIVNDAGAVGVVATTTDDGSGTVVLNNKAGTPMVGLRSENNGGRIVVMNSTSETVVVAGADASGRGFVQVCERKGQCRELLPAR